MKRKWIALLLVCVLLLTLSAACGRKKDNVCVAVFFLISLLRVEKANEKLLEAREDKTVPDVYGNV